VTGIYDHGKQHEMFTVLSGEDGKHLMYGVLYYFGVATGLRVGDILAVKVGQVGAEMDVREAKTGKIKRIKLDDQILRLISGYVDLKGLQSADRLFATTRQTVHRRFKIAGEACGLENIGTHSMRKTYA
jgi:integrase